MYTRELDIWDTRTLDIIDLTKSLYDEQVSNGMYPGTYCEEVVKERLKGYVYHPEMTAFTVHNDNDLMVGFAVIGKDRETCVEFYGVLEGFYIHPAARGTDAARLLRDTVVEWFDAQDCLYSVCADQAFIGRGRAFTNLMLKVGYEEYGSTLVRINKQWVKK